MRLARRGLLTFVVLAIGSCGGQTPTGPGGSPSATTPGPSGEGMQAFTDGLAALTIPSAPDTDLLRERLFAALDLKGALGDQAELVLALVVQAERAAHAQLPHAPRPASRAAPAGDAVTAAYVAAVPLPPKAPPPTTDLMIALPISLEAVGRPGASVARSGPETAFASAEGDGLTATSTMTSTVDGFVAGSAVTITITRTVQSIVVQDVGGAIVLDSSETYTIVGRMDVCPTSAGMSVARLEQAISLEATTNPGAAGRVGTHSTGSVKTSSDFRGQVDDSAGLGAVTQDYTHDEQWTRTAAAEGGPQAKREGAFGVGLTGIGAGVPTEHGFNPGLGDFSTVAGATHASGDATQTMINSTAISAAWDFATIDQAFVAAQKLWRNSRCVVVAVPSYGAESQFDVGNQWFPAHTQKVDQGSVTPFEAVVKHRFGQSVKASLVAELNGKEKLTPTSIATPPGTLTYTAPDEKGQKAGVRITSTSKQGIGNLVIDFDTGSLYEVAAISRWEGFGLRWAGTIEAASLKPTEVSGRYAGSATVKWLVDDPGQKCPLNIATFTSRVDFTGQQDAAGQLTVVLTYQVAEGVWYTYLENCTTESSAQVLSFTPASVTLTVPASGGSSKRPQMLIETYSPALNMSGTAEVTVKPVTTP